MKILKFGAIWCTECLVMRPMWEEIEKMMPELETEYFDADENEEVLKKYGVDKVPVFIFLDQAGQEFLRLKGVQNKDDLIKTIREHISR